MAPLESDRTSSITDQLQKVMKHLDFSKMNPIASDMPFMKQEPLQKPDQLRPNVINIFTQAPVQPMTH